MQLLCNLAYDFILALRRHWRRAAALAAATIMPTLVGLWFLPRHYVSDAKLLVQFSNNLASDARETELNSLLEVFHSRTFAERVVDAVGPEAILRGRLPKGVPPAINAGPGDRRHEQATRKVEQSVSITVPQKLSTVAIRYRAETPEVAQRIAAAFVTACIDEHLPVATAPGSKEFSEEQTQRLEKQWRDASARLREAEVQGDLAALKEKRTLLEQQIADVSTTLLAAEAELAASQRPVEPPPSRVPEALPERPRDTAAEGMQHELFELETQEKQLLARCTEAHPQVIAVRFAIGDLRQKIAGKAVGLSNERPTPSPARQSPEPKRPTEQPASTALRTRIAALNAQREQLRTELANVNQREILVTQLQRDVELAETRYKSYAAQASQAQAIQPRETEPTISLTLLQPASLASEPTGPNPLHVLAMGMLAGLCGGVGLALACYYADPLLKTPSELGRQLDVRVIGPVPACDLPLDAAA